MGGVARQTLTRPGRGYRGPGGREGGRPDAAGGRDRGDEGTVAPVRTRPAVAAPSARDCVAGVARQATSEGVMTEAREKPRTSGDGFAHQAVEDAVARERARIARELHDGIATDLAGAISLFKVYLEGRKGQPDQTLKNVFEIMQRLLKHLREALTALPPPPISPDALASNLREQAHDLARLYAIRADLSSN